MSETLSAAAAADPYHVALVREPSEANRQAFLVFAMATAGKTNRVIVGKVRDFLAHAPRPLAFDSLRALVEEGRLEEAMRAVRLGRYRVLGDGYRYLAASDLDLGTATFDQLMLIPAVGMKTARYLQVYGQGMDYAVLDVHVLRYLREERGVEAPRQTPGYAHYMRLEAEFLRAASELGMDPRELDDVVWRYYSRGEGELPG
jgi:hypothetical protein